MTHVDDQLPGLLRGELSPGAADAASAHLDSCDACRRELAVLARTAAALADAAELPFGDPLELPPLRLPPDHPHAPAGQRRRTAPGTGPWVRRAVLGAAAALVLVAGGVVAVTQLGDRGPAVTATVALGPVGSGPGSGTARMLGSGGGQRMDVTVTGLPAAEPGTFYEVWLLDPSADRVQSVGVLPPDGHGTYALPSAVSASYPVVDVSLEADDGNPAHSADSVLRGTTG